MTWLAVMITVIALQPVHAEFACPVVAAKQCGREVFQVLTLADMQSPLRVEVPTAVPFDGESRGAFSVVWVSGRIAVARRASAPEQRRVFHRRRLVFEQIESRDHVSVFILRFKDGSPLQVGPVTARGRTYALFGSHSVSISPIRLTVSPLVSVREVEDIYATVHTQSDPANALVILDLQGTQTQHSELPLNGEKSPATFQVRYPRLPAGNYALTVILIRHDVRTWEAGRAMQRIHIGPVGEN